MKKDKLIPVDNYGELLASVNRMELIKFEEDGGFQGDFCAVLKGDGRLFYYVDSYGSCSGCDFLEDVGRNFNYGDDDYQGKRYAVPIKEALDYCADLKPKYIVPAESPLKIINKGEEKGFKLIFKK